MPGSTPDTSSCTGAFGIILLISYVIMETRILRSIIAVSRKLKRCAQRCFRCKLGQRQNLIDRAPRILNVAGGVLFIGFIWRGLQRGLCAVECVAANLRRSEEDLGSEVVFRMDEELSSEFGPHWFDVAHVHDPSPLPNSASQILSNLGRLVICLCSRRLSSIPEFSRFSRDEGVQKTPRKVDFIRAERSSNIT